MRPKCLRIFTGDMSEYITLTGQVDTKHRAWEDFGDGSLRDDLLFLGHLAAESNKSRKSLKPPQTSRSRTILLLSERDRLQIFPQFLAFPPGAGFTTLRGCRKAIPVELPAHKPRRP